MDGLLDGKEVDKKIGDVGEVVVDVTKEGKINLSITASYKKDEILSVSSTNTAEVDLFAILEQVAAKSGKPWTESVVAEVKAILGMVG